MPTFEIICLAKSTKLGGLCIAGIKTDGSGWLRPVSHRSDGTLFPEHYTLKDGNEPQIFDIIRIPCLRAEPKCYQPENWLIEPNQFWEVINTPTLKQIQQLLNPEVQRYSSYPQLLGNSDRQIAYSQLIETPAKTSLALIKPRELQWTISGYSAKKYRADFRLGGTLYNLPITDPIWKSQLEQLNPGTYSCVQVIEELELENYEPDNFLLTISIGEPFMGSVNQEEYCYKLVAAVINVTYVKMRFGWI